MRWQGFINFLREEDGRVDQRKVLSISALVGSSVLAQLMFAGIASAGCPGLVPCTEVEKQHCAEIGCVWQDPCSGGLGTCSNP